MGRLARCATMIAVGAALLCSVGVARGQQQSELAKASALYEQGVRAHSSGDYRTAALRFVAADAVVPDPTALQAAMRAALKADDPGLGMRVADRASRYPDDRTLVKLAETLRQRYRERVGRIVIWCDDCTAKLDGDVELLVAAPQWVSLGQHVVLLDVAGKSIRHFVHIKKGEVQDIVVEGGEVRDVAPPAPLPPKPPGRPHSPPPADTATGPSPVWFWVGLGLTTGVGIGTIVSGVDTLQLNEDFEKQPTKKLAHAGEVAEVRTNVLIGATAALAATTAVLGLFVVDWNGDDEPSQPATAAVEIAPGPAWFTVSGHF